MKNIEVVAAVIEHDNKILATQRGYGDLKGMWEFPGGKIESNETKENALKREIKEELNADINIESYLTTVEYDYPNFHLKMHCFLCSLINNKFELIEHTDAKWLDTTSLESVTWLPADLDVIQRYLEVKDEKKLRK